MTSGVTRSLEGALDEAFAQLASPLPRDFRTALESIPAAVRLRIDAGGSESARLAPIASSIA